MPLGPYLQTLVLFLLSLSAGVSSQFAQPQPYLKLLSTLLTSFQNRTSFFDGASSLDTVYDGVHPAYGSLESRESLLQRAEQFISMDICLMLTKLGVTRECCAHTEMVLASIVKKETWALQMLDSFGKIPSGVMLGDFHYPGSYEECHSLKVTINANYTGHPALYQPFQQKYCHVIFPFKQLQFLAAMGLPGLLYGVCVPNSCSPKDISLMVNSGIHLLPFKSTKNFSTTSYCETKPDFDDKAIISLSVCSLFLAVLISATLYHVMWNQGQQVRQPETTATAAVVVGMADPSVSHVSINETNTDPSHTSSPPDDSEDGDTVKLLAAPPDKTSGLAGKVLMCFSVYHNGTKLLKTDQVDGTLSCVHGIRFLSLSWVLLGHVYAFCATAIRNPLIAIEYMKGFAFQGIGNALVSVDSFFLLSGLLVSYSTLRTMRANGGKMNWFYFYIHRFWRLTPPYMLVMMVYIPLFRYIGQGPLWPSQGIEKNFCKDSWYYNLFYINNFIPNATTNMCMAWTWYLANDMQFYWISPFLIVPLYKSPKLGHLLTVLVLLGHLITTAVIATVNHSPITFLMQPNNNGFDTIYIKPYTRIGPYLIGILYGYHLYKDKNKAPLNGYISCMLWSMATISALAVLYGLYNIQNGVIVTEGWSVFYTTANRTVWGVCVGWVVYACCTGYGGFVNTILSWKALIPLSRLTYCAYLVHPLVLFYYYLNQLYPISASQINFVFLFCGCMCITFALSFVASMAFEAPMLGLERLLLEKLRMRK